MRWKNAGADSRAFFCRCRSGSVARPLRGCAARAPSLPCGAKLAPAVVVPPPTITKYCGTALPPMRRTLPWKPIVAMWCCPQPFGQPLILIWAPSACATRSGRSRSVSPSRRPEAARLRDGEAAALGARAAVDVRHGRRIGEAEARGRQPSIQLAHLADRHPAQHQVLVDGDPHGAVAVGAREIAEHAHLLAGQVTERHRDGGGDVAELLLRAHVRVRASGRRRPRWR